MKTLSKLCDAADWFDPEFDRIIRVELEDPPRFHRKQWEFAQIFRALESVGRLTPGSRGLSMGGGHERLSYAVARRAGHLTVTDLYEPGSAWDEARSDDPDRSLKAAAPFPIDPARLTGRRMDMRALEFPDASFDFCYSSCAIEHIGGPDDFLRHLQEVRRVMKDDAVYVLTTEFHYGDAVIPVPHNYYFSSGFLDGLLRAASLATFDGIDGAVRPHPGNRPMPANLGDLCADPASGVAGALLAAVPHVQLLTGGLAFTSLCLVLTRPVRGIPSGLPVMAGLEQSRSYIEAGVRDWKALVEGHDLDLDPFGLVADGRPLRGIARPLACDGDSTLFHTGYVWLGSAARSAVVECEFPPGGAASIEIRIHEKPTLRPDDVTCTASVAVEVGGRTRVGVSVPLAPEDHSSYAVLGKVTAGACAVTDARVRVPARR